MMFIWKMRKDRSDSEVGEVKIQSEGSKSSVGSKKGGLKSRENRITSTQTLLL